MKLTNKYLIFFIAALLLVFVSLLFYFWPTKRSVFDENKIYTIAVDRNWEPLMLSGREKNLFGFTTDLVRAISRETGFRAQIFEVSGLTLRQGLDDQRYDGIISPLTPNAILKQYYIFSEPFYMFGPVLVVRTDSEITRPEDLDGKEIGITKREAPLLYDMPRLYVRTFPSTASALENLDRDQIDAVILEAIPAYVMTQGTYKGRLKVITSPLTDEGLRLITRDDPEYQILVSRFNEGLDIMIRNGTYADLIKKWGLIDPVIK